uniref:Secreted protein n=1 Tax=Panagrellus redivivus TaxID=6233 RepID=A0A7E4VIV9_PANRE
MFCALVHNPNCLQHDNKQFCCTLTVVYACAYGRHTAASAKNRCTVNVHLHCSMLALPITRISPRKASYLSTNLPCASCITWLMTLSVLSKFAA